MPESKQSSSNLGASGVAWILLAAAGTYFVVHTPPLEGNRPPTTEAFLRAPPSVQDVNSRLWQDPFAAIVDKLTKSTDLKPENCDVKIEVRDHCVSPLSAASDPASPPPIVIAASVTGAPYSEDHEFRRRIRYAIGAGLDRQGFVPGIPSILASFGRAPSLSRTPACRMSFHSSGSTEKRVALMKSARKTAPQSRLI